MGRGPRRGSLLTHGRGDLRDVYIQGAECLPGRAHSWHKSEEHEELSRAAEPVFGGF